MNKLRCQRFLFAQILAGWVQRWAAKLVIRLKARKVAVKDKTVAN